MIKIHLLLAAVTIAFSSFSQSVSDYTYDDGRVNDFTIVEDILEKKYPGYKQYADQLHNDIANQVNFGGGSRDVNGVLVIPVVFHVVWKEVAENISDAEVMGQLNVMNEDFMRLNADTVNMRAVFDPIKGSPNIKFELAGIERRQTNADFNIDFGGGLYDAIKDSNEGGSNAWNTTTYLNIWVGNLKSFGQGSQILGYAYPPMGTAGWPAGQSPADPNDDGVVIHYEAFGASGTFNGNTLKGRTTTHEIGHYLGLRHIWGDGDCSADDNVGDTPIAFDRSSFDCNKFKNTCNSGTVGDYPDMVENYMDYSSETCQNSFTKGQGDFMRNVLVNLRPNNYYVESDGKEVTTGFLLFPNPSSGIVNYRINDNELPSNLRVYSMSGKIVYSQVLEESRGTINIPELAEGVYNISAKGAGYKHIEKIVISK